MGKLHACLVVGIAALAACGSDSKKPDAGIVVHDSAIDAKVIDAPPDAPSYDFSCYGQTGPTTAAATISVSGTAQALSQGGAQAVAGVAIAGFKVSNDAPIGTATSDAQGAWTVSGVSTGGTPLDAYVKASIATYRTSYLYTPSPLVADTTMVPVLLISDATFTGLSQITQKQQDDTVNGFIAAFVTDCANKPIPDAVLKIQQGGADKGDQFNLGALSQQAAGTYFVYNVPDGATQVFATYMGKTFPTKTVMAHKKPAGQGAEGTLTLVNVRPGP